MFDHVLSGRRWRRATVLLLILATGVALWSGPELAGELYVLPDAEEYAVSAERLVSLGRFDVVRGGRAHPPRYPPCFPVLFLSPVYAIARGNPGYGVLPVWMSALGIAVLLAWFCGRALPSRLAVPAAYMATMGMLCLYGFRKNAREVMSDVPVLLLGFAALGVFLRCGAVPRARHFLLAGLLVAVAGSMRWPALAFILPFSWLWLTRPDARNARTALLLTAPVIIAVAANLAYNQHAFGHPLFSGYQYWLTPDSYGLSPAHIGANLRAATDPFVPPHRRVGWLALAGPACLSLQLLCGLLCMRFRRRTWRASRPMVLFWLFAGAPILIFHLLYPFHHPRFFLFSHAMLVALSAIWFASLFGPLVKRLPVPIILIVCAAAPAFQWFERTQRTTRRRPTCELASRVLPDNAVLVSAMDEAFVEPRVLRGTRRTYMPLGPGTGFATCSVGKMGQRREALYSENALDHPESLTKHLRSGRRVFMEASFARMRGHSEHLDTVLKRFRVTIVEPDTLMELHLRKPQQ